MIGLLKKVYSKKLSMKLAKPVISLQMQVLMPHFLIDTKFSTIKN
jgi:hypothetical protein